MKKYLRGKLFRKDDKNISFYCFQLRRFLRNNSQKVLCKFKIPTSSYFKLCYKFPYFEAIPGDFSAPLLMPALTIP